MIRAKSAASSADSHSAALDKAGFVLDSAEVRLLTEIGFLASAVGDVRRAQTVFLALQRLRPGRAFPLVGLAVTKMNAGCPNDAVLVLEQAQASCDAEQNVMDAWRGLALQLAGREGESKRLLMKVALSDGDGAALAKSLLGMGKAERQGAAS